VAPLNAGKKNKKEKKKKKKRYMLAPIVIFSNTHASFPHSSALPIQRSAGEPCAATASGRAKTQVSSRKGRTVSETVLPFHRGGGREEGEEHEGKESPREVLRGEELRERSLLPFPFIPPRLTLSSISSSSFSSPHTGYCSSGKSGAYTGGLCIQNGGSGTFKYCGK